MTVSPGSHLGPYEVLTPLGAGGPAFRSADAKAYVYSYRRLLDDLYVITGVQ